MPVITQSDNAGNSLSFSFTLWDEFLPIVGLKDPSVYKGEKPSINKCAKIQLGLSSNQVQLSDSLDESHQTLIPYEVITKKRTQVITCKVSKGCVDSKDDDGIVEIRLSINDPDVKMVSNSKVQAKYGSEFDIEIKIAGQSKKEFLIDFYSSDNDDNNVGELTNVHCGRLKYIFDYCSCVDWQTIAPVIPSSKFVGWNSITYPGWECYDYAVEQLKVAGYKPKAAGWADWSNNKLEMSKGIYQIFLEKDVAGMKKGVQKSQFTDGVEYLKNSLNSNIPILVGVDDDYFEYNADKTTEHFVVIVGMGEDSEGKYFLFYDNSTGDPTVGASSENKLYCYCKLNKLEGVGDLRNVYIQGAGKKRYLVSQIRETI